MENESAQYKETLKILKNSSSELGYEFGTLSKKISVDAQRALNEWARSVDSGSKKISDGFSRAENSVSGFSKKVDNVSGILSTFKESGVSGLGKSAGSAIGGSVGGLVGGIAGSALAMIGKELAAPLMSVLTDAKNQIRSAYKDQERATTFSETDRGLSLNEMNKRTANQIIENFGGSNAGESDFLRVYNAIAKQNERIANTQQTGKRAIFGENGPLSALRQAETIAGGASSDFFSILGFGNNNSKKTTSGGNDEEIQARREFAHASRLLVQKLNQK